MSFEINDPVKIVDRNSIFFDRIGEVIGFSDGFVDVRFADNFYTWSYYPNQVEKVK